VAGASSGLGLAAARSLAAEGVTVAICSRDRGRIDAAAAEIGGNVTPLVADVGTPEGAASFAQAALDALGGIDILVANAGGPPPGDFASTSLDAYQQAIDLNLLSTVAMCRAVVPLMQQRQWGRVVAITSLGVRQPIKNLIASVTARAGVTGFLKSLALEVAADRVTVNSVQPGLHDTDRLRSLHGADLSGVATDVPLGVVGDAADFGSVVTFLCSEQAGYITGVALPVDGGSHRGLL
jgi:3-oxoacyl-[acyl-carrier protein] reductase